MSKSTIMENKHILKLTVKETAQMHVHSSHDPGVC